MRSGAVLLLLCALLTPSFAQQKIGNKIYLYGDVENKLKGTIAILFLGADPQTEMDVINKFTAHGCEAVSYNNLFMPGVDYTNDEFMETLKDFNIQGIIYIYLTNVSMGSYHYSNTVSGASAYSTLNYATISGYSSTTGGSINYAAAVNLKIEVYSVSNQYERPVGVIIGQAVGSGGVMSTTRSISKKIMGRVVTGLLNENAFD